MPDTALIDVDGTLVDTNYHHALAWFRAFRRCEITLPLWHLHRAIGMGGDRLVAHVAGHQIERRQGQQLREFHLQEFDALIEEICPVEQASELLGELKQRRFRLALATSGKSRHVDRLLDLIDGKAIADAWLTSDDVARSKPAPDLIHAALHSVQGTSAVLVGDSIWDCQAGAELDVPTLAVRTGGFSPDELTAAGASAVFESLPALIDSLDGTPLAQATGEQTRN